MTTTSTVAPGSFSPKGVSEIFTLAWDFAPILGADTLSTCSVTASTYEGTDASPSSVLSGVAAISGTKVVQRVTGGVDGCTYLLAATGNTAGGSRYVLYGLLPVRLPA